MNLDLLPPEMRWFVLGTVVLAAIFFALLAERAVRTLWTLLGWDDRHVDAWERNHARPRR